MPGFFVLLAVVYWEPGSRARGAQFWAVPVAGFIYSLIFAWGELGQGENGEADEATAQHATTTSGNGTSVETAGTSGLPVVAGNGSVPRERQRLADTQPTTDPGEYPQHHLPLVPLATRSGFRRHLSTFSGIKPQPHVAHTDIARALIMRDDDVVQDLNLQRLAGFHQVSRRPFIVRAW